MFKTTYASSVYLLMIPKTFLMTKLGHQGNYPRCCWSPTIPTVLLARNMTQSFPE